MALDETKLLNVQVEPDFNTRTNEFHPADDKDDLMGIENLNSSKTVPQKNALVLLHEFKPDLKFRLVSQTGPSHAPVFTMAVEVNGELFTGVGKRRKLAKLHAAQNILMSILRHTDGKEASVPQNNALVVLHKMKPDLEFRLVSQTGPSHAPVFKMAVEVNGELFTGVGKRKKLAKLNAAKNVIMSIIQHTNGTGASSLPHKNALVLLHDIRPDLEFRLVSSTGPSHAPVFTMAVEVNGESFIGVGKRKKEAKLNAAQHVLKSILKLTDEPEVSGCLKSNEGFTTDIAIDNSNCLHAGPWINAVSQGYENVRAEGQETSKNSGMSLMKSEGIVVGNDIDDGYLMGDESHSSGGSIPQRETLMFLHVFRPDFELWLISRTGPGHSLSFTMAVEVNGTLFIAQGKRRKRAKVHEAHLFSTSILQFTDVPEVSGCCKSNEDFTSDISNSNFLFTNALCTETDEFVRDEERNMKNCGMASAASEGAVVECIPAEYATPATTDVGTQTEEYESETWTRRESGSKTSAKKKRRHLKIWKRFCSCFGGCFARKK